MGKTSDNIAVNGMETRYLTSSGDTFLIRETRKGARLYTEGGEYIGLLVTPLVARLVATLISSDAELMETVNSPLANLFSLSSAIREAYGTFE